MIQSSTIRPRMFVLALTLFALLGLGVGQNDIHADTILVIDSYIQDFTSDVPPDPNPSTIYETDAAGVLNGDRVSFIERVSPTGTVYIRTDPIEPGFVELVASLGAQGLWRITYGSQTPLNLDLTQFGQGKFVLSQFLCDNSGVGGTVSIEVTSSSGSALLTRVVTSEFSVDFLDMDFVFTDFATFGSFSWADVQTVMIEVDGLPDGDYSWEPLYIIPEPASVILLGLGSMLVLSRTRRAK